MIGVMASFENPDAPLSTPLDLYLHGYHTARLNRTASSTQAPPSNDDDTSPSTGFPVTVAATHVDGLVLALTPMHHSLNYRSAVLFGRAHPVTPASPEHLFALRLLTDAVLPGRWAGTRVPPTAAELASTTVLRVEIESASAKVREGGPSEDRADERDEEVRGRVWTGVVGVRSVYGEPVPAEGNRVEVPGYLTEFLEKEKEKGGEGKTGWMGWLGLA